MIPKASPATSVFQHRPRLSSSSSSSSSSNNNISGIRSGYVVVVGVVVVVACGRAGGTTPGKSSGGIGNGRSGSKSTDRGKTSCNSNRAKGSGGTTCRNRNGAQPESNSLNTT